ncbi:MAG: lysine--tRNA ligase [Clostridiales bacterium]|jgi:lysyl-tRNA synthetase class 2|nr:lysine--tRNA ligase [Clostridiales bacterium]
MSEPVQEDLDEQGRIRRDKLHELQNSGADPFRIVRYDVTHRSGAIKSGFETLAGTKVSAAGRMMTRRVMGKASFCDVADAEGHIQAYVRRDDVGAESYAAFKKFDIGDIIGIRGKVFKTQMGEISIHAEEVTLLAKSLHTLPEKWHGLRDQELRYRQRYLDLIVNPEVKEVFLKRSSIIKAIRAFLDARGFLEVETPVLQTIPGGASARPFVTHHNALDIDMYMRISPELLLKQLIIGGLERVYEIGRAFRNEGLSIKHNPEFTLLELYQAYTDYYGMMDLTESLIKEAVKTARDTFVIKYGDIEIDFAKSFEKMTMLEAVKKYSGVDFTGLSLETARALAAEREIETEARHGAGDILSLFFEKYAEEHLVQPTFIMDYPVEISPLTKRKPDNPDFTERFELFILGREFANAYSELNDPLDQRGRFIQQERMREAGDGEAQRIDEDFLLAMEYGMPPTGGLGIGIDRLVMLLTESYSIRDVLLFPTMKPAQ